MYISDMLLTPEMQIPYRSYFVRLKSELYVLSPEERENNIITIMDLADAHGLTDDIKRLREEKSPEVDGGSLLLEHPEGFLGLIRKSSFTIEGWSRGLMVPVWDMRQEARAETAGLVRQLYPGHAVYFSVEPEPHTPGLERI